MTKTVFNTYCMLKKCYIYVFTFLRILKQVFKKFKIAIKIQAQFKLCFAYQNFLFFIIKCLFFY